MNVISSVTALIGSAAMAGTVGLSPAGGAPAEPAVPFGTQRQVADAAYTVADLAHAGSDALTVPLTGTVPLAGDLWQATTTVAAIRGSVVPAMQSFSARAADGRTYPMLEVTLAPDVRISPMSEGRSSTGRIYFDVTGPAPTEVVFDDGVHQRVTWRR